MSLLQSFERSIPAHVLSFFLFFIAVMMSGTAVAQQSVTWTGSSDGFDFTNPGNWDMVPTNTDTTLNILDIGNLADDFIINNGNTVDFFDAAGLGGATNAYSVTVDANSSLNMTDNSGTFYGMRGAAALNIDNGGSVSGQFIAGITASIGTGASLFLAGAGNPINLSTIDMAGDLSGTIVSLETVADFSSEHLSKITVNGLPASLVGGNIKLTSDSSLDYTGDGTPDTVTIAQGLAGSPFVFADFDGDGDIDATDWMTLRGNLFGSSGAPVDPANPTAEELQLSYSMGDLDNNFLVDLNDFSLFDDAYDAENGTGAFAAMVPEPTTAVYTCFLLLMGLALRRRIGRLTASNNRWLVPGLLIISVLLIAGSTEAEIVYTGAGADPNDVFDEANYDFSTSPLFDPGNPTADIVMEATQAELAAGTVVALNDDITFSNATISPPVNKGFGSVSIGPGFTTTFDNVIYSTNTATGTASNGGLSGNNTIANGGSDSGHPCLSTTSIAVTNGSSLDLQFVIGSVMTIDGTSSVSFRGAGNPVNDGLGGVGLVMEQGAQVTFPGTNNFGSTGGAGEAPFIWAANASGELVRFVDDATILSFDGAGTTATAVNANTLGARCPVGITVHQGTGEIKISNPNTAAAFTVDMDAYSVTSAGGSLDLASWNSLQDQNLPAFPAGNGSGNGWEEGGQSNANEFGEAFLTGTSTLAAGASVSLGNAYDTTINAVDLGFTFRDINGALAAGTVTYIPATGGVACDADADGDCILDDIGAMYVQAGAAGSFDFDGNGTIGPEDVAGWLAAASTSANSANPTGRTLAVGDLDLDFDVDSTDLGLLLNNFNTMAASPGAGVGYGGGDVNMDGNVNSTDLGQLLNNFNFVGAASAAAVPEPNGICLILLALFAGLMSVRARDRS